MPDTLSREQQEIALLTMVRERAWNALIPPCAIKAEVRPYGVAYLHPTKGWRSVGKKRFALRGVM
jgi:hypothetical protein